MIKNNRVMVRGIKPEVWQAARTQATAESKPVGAWISEVIEQALRDRVNKVQEEEHAKV